MSTQRRVEADAGVGNVFQTLVTLQVDRPFGYALETRGMRRRYVLDVVNPRYGLRQNVSGHDADWRDGAVVACGTNGLWL